MNHVIELQNVAATTQENDTELPLSIISLFIC